MAQAGAATQAVYTQGSCVQQGVYMDTDRGCGTAEVGMSRATARQRHWWLSRAGRYDVSRDDGGSD